MTSLLHEDGYGSTFANFVFDYDENGWLTEEVFNGVTTTFGYDDDGQLTSAGTASYSFDANGNRDVSMGYVTGPGNRLLSDGVWTYSYDFEGNLIKKSLGAHSETWLYEYDNANRLVGIEQWSEDPAYMGTGYLIKEWVFHYDIFGNRIAQEIDHDGEGVGGFTVTLYAYLDQNAWADLDGSSDLMTRRLYLDGVDQLFARINEPSHDVAWYYTDRLGSVTSIADDGGDVQVSLTYDAFGNPGTPTGSNVSFLDRYQYTGREFDADTGLQYNRARFYDPMTGRWISEDPKHFGAGDPNLYRYVGNAPTNATDPSGLEDKDKGIVRRAWNAGERNRDWWVGFWKGVNPRFGAFVESATSADTVNTFKNVTVEVNPLWSRETKNVAQGIHVATVRDVTLKAADLTIDGITYRVQKTWDAGVSTVKWVVNESGKQLAYVGDRLVEVGQNAVNGFVEHVKAFGENITKLWKLADDFKAAAGKLVTAVVSDPKVFFTNLKSGLGDGFKRFFENIPNKLPAIVLEWLTNTDDPSKLVPKAPASFKDPIEVGRFALEFLGVTWDSLKARAVVKLPGPARGVVIKAIDGFQQQGVDGLKKLVEKYKKELEPDKIEAKVKEEGKSFLVKTVTEVVAKKALSLIFPAAGVLKSVYDGFTWVVSKASKLLGAVDKFVQGMKQLAEGNPAEMAGKIEETLNDALKLAIDFAAKMLNLDNLPQGLKGALHKVQNIVWGNVDKVFAAMVPGAVVGVAGIKGAMGNAPKTVGTAAQEVKSVGAFTGKSAAEIDAQLTAAGYSKVKANNGGTIYTKAGSDGNTVAVRVDPPMVRAKPKGFADEVPHVHKEVVPTNKVTNGNYSPSDATKLNDLGVPTTDPKQTHIPGGH